MNYLVERDENIQRLHKIYAHDGKIPDYIKQLLDIKELQRLHGVSYNSGACYTGFDKLKYGYSKLDHSLGMALILDNFITNNKQVVAALFHDLAVPAFADSITYIDEKNYDKDDVEPTLADTLVKSDQIFDYFLANNMSISDVCNHTQYPLAYNFVPHLSAHSLEYFLHTMYLGGMCSDEEIEEMYSNLVVTPNKDNMPEFTFLNRDLAWKFCILSLECGELYRSYEMKASMKFIADTVAAMVRRRVITRKDLYECDDRTIMEIGLNCTDKRISDRWNFLPHLDVVHTMFNEAEDKKSYKIFTDLKYADPLIKCDDDELRTSKKFEICRRKITEFKDSDTDLFFFINYED